MNIITNKYDVDWQESPLFNVGDKVVFLQDSWSLFDSKKNDGAATYGSILGYGEDNFIYWVRVLDSKTTLGYRVVTVYEDEVTLARQDLDGAYPYTTPEPADIGVEQPFRYMEERVEAELYRPTLTNTHRAVRHPDWDSHHPDVLRALQKASLAEGQALMEVFIRDIKNAYGLVGFLKPYGNRIMRHVLKMKSGSVQWPQYVDQDDKSIDFKSILYKVDALVSLTRDYQMTYTPDMNDPDNPLVTTTPHMPDSYVQALQKLPEPYRSQLLYGTFSLEADDKPTSPRETFVG